MLIASPRHRLEDLELWKDLEEADLAYSRSRRLDSLVEKSLSEIESFFDEDCYASISWGKDSTVLAHLIWQTGLSIPCVFVRPKNLLSTPERNEVRDCFLSRFPLKYREIEVAYSKTGTEEENDKLFFAAFKSCGMRHISGIRADESSGRMIRMRKHGLSSKNASAPLGWWKVSDVFAYMAKFDLPIHPVYAMLGGGRWDRERIRVDDIGGERGQILGRAEWEREYYGDILNRLI